MITAVWKIFTLQTKIDNAFRILLDIYSFKNISYFRFFLKKRNIKTGRIMETLFSNLLLIYYIFDYYVSVKMIIYGQRSRVLVVCNCRHYPDFDYAWND